jgi:hypothetical protein
MISLSRASFAVALACGFGVSGCQTTGGVGPGAFNFVRAVPAGQTLKLDHFANLNPDCSSAGDIAVRVLQDPANGKIAIKQAADFSTYPPFNPRSHCNDRRTPGVSVFYTPNQNYLGPDSVIFDIIFANGLERSDTFHLSVK